MRFVLKRIQWKLCLTKVVGFEETTGPVEVVSQSEANIFREDAIIQQRECLGTDLKCFLVNPPKKMGSITEPCPYAANKPRCS
ncbi:hypothetical protein AV530_014889 [Patagioenas fasciata monilis]|uniref:Uncharacterized protein n=1 Tax=Patagioenas fasciata monilis TaxID=372326 RepID=A0A1V4K4P0_PATFA|nr:hypothetical protein AV530_014889 [Patagioenas fasciata monilis]